MSRTRLLVCWLLTVLCAAVGATHASDTAIASAPGSDVVTGALAVAGGTLHYRAEGGKLTLSVTHDQVAVNYADGTPMATLQAGDTLLITGELFTKGIGGTVNSQGFTLAPGLRFTIKNRGSRPVSFFDNRLAKTVLLPSDAVVNIEVKEEKLRNSDDVFKALKPGQVLKLPHATTRNRPIGALSRTADGLLLIAYDKISLATAGAQVDLAPDTGVLISGGLFKLVDGRLVWADGAGTWTALSGGVVLVSPAGKFDLAPGRVITAAQGKFSALTDGTPPAGIIFVRATGSRSIAQRPIEPGDDQPAPPNVILAVPQYSPLGSVGHFK